MRAEELTPEAREAVDLPWDQAPGSAKRGEATLYRDALLDRLTLAPPWLPYLLMGPLAAVVLIRPLGTLSLGRIALLLLAGALTWTLVEYLMHRFLFHARSERPALRVVLLIVHGHHHVWPDDVRRVAASPVQFLSLALLFWGVFSSALTRVEAMATFAGFVLAYLAYEVVHYTVHHGRSRNRVISWLRRYHMQHHYSSPERRFGVSSPFWDHVFRTHR